MAEESQGKDKLTGKKTYTHGRLGRYPSISPQVSSRFFLSRAQFYSDWIVSYIVQTNRVRVSSKQFKQYCGIYVFKRQFRWYCRHSKIVPRRWLLKDPVQ